MQEEGAPLHYKEIAGKITERLNIKTTGDQVLGAIGGWYAHSGSEYLMRTGPGRYGVRPGKVFVAGTTSDDTAASYTEPPAALPPLASKMAAVQDAQTELPDVGVAVGAVLPQQAPYYQLAQEILRETRMPMHYRDIAAALRAAGRDVHQDTIMGSLNGYINTAAGKATLMRVGKGTYTLREFVKSGVVKVGADGNAVSPVFKFPAPTGANGRFGVGSTANGTLLDRGEDGSDAVSMDESEHVNGKSNHRNSNG